MQCNPNSLIPSSPPGMSSGSVTSIAVGVRGMPTKCHCGSEVTIFTSKTQENPGRPFFRCTSRREATSRFCKRDGHIFKWIEDALVEEVEDALTNLATIGCENSRMKAEAIELKGEIQEMKLEIIQIKMEIRRSHMYLQLCFLWIFLISIVVVFVLVGNA